MKHLSLSDERKLRSMSECGMSVRQIAKEFGVTHSTIHRLLKRRGLGRRRCDVISKPRIPIDERKLISLALDGRSVRQVAKELGISIRTSERRLRLVRGSLKPLQLLPAYIPNIPKKPAKTLKPSMAAKAASMRAAGLGIRPLAKHFGVSDDTIRRTLGIPPLNWRRLKPIKPVESIAVQSLTDKCTSSRILPLSQARELFGFIG